MNLERSIPFYFALHAKQHEQSVMYRQLSASGLINGEKKTTKLRHKTKTHNNMKKIDRKEKSHTLSL